MAKNNKNLKVGIAVVAVVVIITVSTALYQQSSTNNAPQTTQDPSSSNNNNLSENSSPYANGEYSVTGNYISPGGAEQIGVTITLEDGEIVESEVEPMATREISVEKQNDFADNYKPLVVGKNIDEVSLTKVSGSSLTPEGFNDALEQVKEQARIENSQG